MTPGEELEQLADMQRQLAEMERHFAERYTALAERYLSRLDELDRWVTACVHETAQLRARCDEVLAARPDDAALRQAITQLWR